MKETGITYNKENLLEDLLTTPIRTNDQDINHEKASRDYPLKLKVIQLLRNLKTPYDDKDNNENDVKKAIENLVENDETLFGYTFYVASNPIFDYTWSYLKTQMDNYKSFLFNAHRFFAFICRDIQILRPILLAQDPNTYIVFNDMIKIEFMNMAPYAKAYMQWENFSNITQVGNGYRLSIKVKESTRAVCGCTYNDTAKQLSDKIEKLSYYL